MSSSSNSSPATRDIDEGKLFEALGRHTDINGSLQQFLKGCVINRAETQDGLPVIMVSYRKTNEGLPLDMNFASVRGFMFTESPEGEYEFVGKSFSYCPVTSEMKLQADESMALMVLGVVIIAFIHEGIVRFRTQRGANPAKSWYREPSNQAWDLFVSTLAEVHSMTVDQLKELLFPEGTPDGTHHFMVLSHRNFHSYRYDLTEKNFIYYVCQQDRTGSRSYHPDYQPCSIDTVEALHHHLENTQGQLVRPVLLNQSPTPELLEKVDVLILTQNGAKKVLRGETLMKSTVANLSPNLIQLVCMVTCRSSFFPVPQSNPFYAEIRQGCETNLKRFLTSCLPSHLSDEVSQACDLAEEYFNRLFELLRDFKERDFTVEMLARRLPEGVWENARTKQNRLYTTLNTLCEKVVKRILGRAKNPPRLMNHPVSFEDELLKVLCNEDGVNLYRLFKHLFM